MTKCDVDSHNTWPLTFDRAVCKFFLTIFCFLSTLLSHDGLYAGFGLVTGFIELLQDVSTNKYDSLTALHTPKITVTTAHIFFSVCYVLTNRCLVTDPNNFLTILPAGGCLTTNSLLKLSTQLTRLQYLGTDHTENTILLLLLQIVAVHTYLFAKQLLSNGCCI
jgi:hypothetical protein